MRVAKYLLTRMALQAPKKSRVFFLFEVDFLGKKLGEGSDV